MPTAADIYTPWRVWPTSLLGSFLAFVPGTKPRNSARKPASAGDGAGAHSGSSDLKISRRCARGAADFPRAAGIVQLIFLASFFVETDLDDAAVQQAVTILGRECSPRLSEKEIKNAIEQSKESRGQLKDATIAGYLKVTSEEARAVPRWADSQSLQEVRAFS